MAKKKEEVEAGVASIIKKYGNVLSTGKVLFEKKQNLKCLNVSPAFNLGLNGGLLEGTWTIISGDAKTGKSSWCLQVAANGQKEGRHIIYLDGESRLKNYNLEGTVGLDREKMTIVHSADGEENLAAEDFLDICEALIKLPQNRGSVCIIDSCSSLVPRSELDSGSSGTIRASLPKLLSHWIKKNAQNVTKNNIVMLIITHYITNTSGYGKTKIPDCGVMVQYQADTRVDIKNIEPWEESGKKIGQIINCEISCSSMGASGGKVRSFLRYGKGIDFIKETVELAELFGLIDKAGAWYNIDCLSKYPEHQTTSEVKFQGQEKLYNYVAENSQIFDILQVELKKALE